MKDNNMIKYTLKGIGTVLNVYDKKIEIIPKGFFGFLFRGIKGVKTIPFSSICALQFKQSGIFSGYMQFTIPGGNESKKGLMDTFSDENTFVFKGQKELALEIKSFIEEKIS